MLGGVGSGCASRQHGSGMLRDLRIAAGVATIRNGDRGLRRDMLLKEFCMQARRVGDCEVGCYDQQGLPDALPTVNEWASYERPRLPSFTSDAQPHTPESTIVIEFGVTSGSRSRMGG